METASNGAHRNPIGPRVIVIKPEALAHERAERKRREDGKKQQTSRKAEAEKKRRKSREYYYANRKRILAHQKIYDDIRRGKSKKLPVVSKEGGSQDPAVPKRPSKLDALICVHRSLAFMRDGDLDGAELWARFAARIIEGKE